MGGMVVVPFFWLCFCVVLLLVLVLVFLLFLVVEENMNGEYDVIDVKYLLLGKWLT